MIFFELSHAEPLLLKLIDIGIPDIIIPVKNDISPETPEINFKLKVVMIIYIYFYSTKTHIIVIFLNE